MLHMSLSAILPVECATYVVYVSFALYAVIRVNIRFSIAVPQIIYLYDRNAPRFYCL